MRVLEKVPDVGEERRSVGALERWSVGEHWGRVAWCVFRILRLWTLDFGLWTLVLFDLIKPVCLDSANRANVSIPPSDFQTHPVGGGAGCKDPERIVARKVTAAANHFLALGHRP